MSVFDGIGNKFTDNEAERDGLVYRKNEPGSGAGVERNFPRLRQAGNDTLGDALKITLSKQCRGVCLKTDNAGLLGFNVNSTGAVAEGTKAYSK